MLIPRVRLAYQCGVTLGWLGCPFLKNIITGAPSFSFYRLVVDVSLVLFPQVF